MKWNRIGDGVLPDEKHDNKEILIKIDHNCGYMVVRWNNTIKRFIPLTFYNQEIAINLITGASDWCEINA